MRSASRSESVQQWFCVSFMVGRRLAFAAGGSALSANRDVTIVIACFDYGRYLGEAVTSALAQEGGPPHVVVVDDGSTEPETLRVLETLPSDVELVRQENAGVCRARNAGLARVDTPFALVLDADDRLAHDALARLLPPLEAEAKLGFAYGTMEFFGDWSGELRFPDYDPFALLYRHTIGLCALARREVFEDTGGFDPAFEQFEDWELWVNALAHGWRGRRVDAVTLEYRRHGDTKLVRDRGRYRTIYRQLRRKHAALYAQRSQLARASRLGVAGRLTHMLYWGPRPLPGRLEQALYRLRWGSKGA
jgi:glycosyltransferase involved in cell wall biosynthesis